MNIYKFTLKNSMAHENLINYSSKCCCFLFFFNTGFSSGHLTVKKIVKYNRNRNGLKGKMRIVESSYKKGS